VAASATLPMEISCNLLSRKPGGKIVNSIEMVALHPLKDCGEAGEGGGGGGDGLDRGLGEVQFPGPQLEL